MLPQLEEHRNVSLVGYHDLNDRPGFKMDLQVLDDRWYLYLGHFWHSGWTVLDVTDPEDPSFETFVPGPENTTTKQMQVADGLMITALERSELPGPGGDVDEVGAAGAYIWDVETDPTEPELLGHYSAADGRGTHRNFYNGGDYAFMCANKVEYESVIDRNYFLTIVDVSDPTEPVEVAEWTWPGQHPDDDEDPVYRYFHGPAYVQDDAAFVSYGRAGLAELDVSDVERPEARYTMDMGEALGSHNGVHSFIPIPDTDLAVANSEAIAECSPLEAAGNPFQYTFILDVSDKRDPGFDGRDHYGPRVIGSVPLPQPQDHVPWDTYYEKPGRYGPHNQHHPRGEETRFHSSDLLVMTYFNAGLRLYDISDPLFPEEVGHAVPAAPERRIDDSRPSSGLTAQLEDVVVDSRGYIYGTDPQQGVFIFRSSLVE